MIHIEAANLIAASSFIAGCVSEWRVLIQVMNAGYAPPHSLQMETKAHFLKSLERIRDTSAELTLTATKAAATRAFDECLEVLGQNRPYTARELQFLISHAERVVHPFNDEVRARLFFTMDANHAGFYSDATAFGKEVDDAFPSAAPEIVDAGKCRALGRWTACVLHLMRALEPALNALARHVGVEPDQNWNTALNQIDAKSPS